MTISALVVSLEANIAKYTSDMGKAAAIAEQQMARVDKVMGIATTAMKAMGAAALVGLSLDAVKSKIESAISLAAGLQQLSERTGATVEGLSSLAAVAKLSGTDTETLAGGLQKLSKAMNDAEHGGAKNVEAFKAIGLSVDDIKGKKPDEMFLVIANRLSMYADGASKTALMQQLLGKSGANLLPVMNDLAIVGEYQVKVTKEQAALADEYEKNMVRVEAAQKAVYKVIAFQMLPVMNAFSKAMLEAIAGGNGIKKTADELAADNSIQEWAKSAATGLGWVVDSFDLIGRMAQIAVVSIKAGKAALDFKGTGNAVQDVAVGDAMTKQWKDKVEQILMREQFSAILDRKLASVNKYGFSGAAGGGRGGQGVPEKKDAVFDTSKNGKGDDPSKIRMESALKSNESFISQEKTQLATREKYLQDFYSQEYMDANTYYSTKELLIKDALEQELATYAAEKAAVATYLASSQDKNKQAIADAKNAEIAIKVTNAQTDASKRLTDTTLEQAKIYRDFDLATNAVAHSAQLANDQAKFQLSMMGLGTLEVAKFTAAKTIQVALEERLYQMRQKNLPEDQIAKAVAEAEQQKAAAVQNVTDAYNKQRTAEFGVSEAFRKYAEDAGNLAAHMENTMTNAFKGMEDALVNFVKTGKLDFSSLVDSIISDIARMMIQESIMAPLTAGFKSGGIGGFLSAGASLLGFAGGGDPPVGMASVVGENGPELFVPKTAGTIIPNGQLGGGNITNIINITAPIGDIASKGDVVSGMRTVANQIVSQISRSQRYGGAMA